MIDQVSIILTSGNGGNGAVSGRREKFVPYGGPDGGDGGRGGNVYLRCDRNMSALLAFRRNKRYRAGNGGDGASKKRHGKQGADIELVAPLGSQVWDEASDTLIADLTEHGERVEIAMGGRGGRGNVRFRSPTNRFPLLAEEGDPGVELRARLELKLLADVGIVGAPNAGKSSLLAALTSARPKVADYPFTTLEPVLGVVDHGEDGFVMVDIPGLIEGAHAGIGLGDEFLRHVERTRVLVHVIDGSGPDPVADYRLIREELNLYDASLSDKREVIAFNKADIAGVADAFELCRDELAPTGAPARLISAAARTGLDALLQHVASELALAREEVSTPPQTPVEPGSPLQDADGGVPILRPKPVDEERERVRALAPGRYEVTLRAAARLVGVADVANWQVRAQLHEQLRRQGVLTALEHAGIRPGDTYVIGKHELEWE